MSKSSNEDAISQILASLIQESQASSEERVAAWLALPDIVDVLEAISELNPEHFDLLFNLPVREGTEALLSECFSDQILDRPRMLFLFSQSRFVESHFSRLFQQYEGNEQSAEKSRTLLRALAHFFASGQPICFDYSGPNQHLPQRIFTHHQAIFDFFEGLYRLYHGQPELYFKAIGELLDT